MAPKLRVLTDQQRAALAEGALRLLADVGVRLTEPAARSLLRAAGARLADDRVLLPQELVQRVLARAPSSVTIFDRNNAPALHLTRQNTYFGAHVDAPDVIDPITGKRRPCVTADVRRHAALINALPNIAFATASGLIADVPAACADRAALAECLKHTAKPVLIMPVTPQALDDCRRLAAAAVGGDKALRRQPNVIVYVEPVSPLSHPDDSIRKLLYCADHLLPVAYVPYAAMGGTAPQDPAAIIVQLCAESLSALVVHQLRRPKAPFIFGGMASLMDMRTTVFSYGAPEFQRGNTMMAEMAHYFRLPNFGTAGASDAQGFDGQAIMEATTSCLLAAASGAQLIHDVGLLGSATVVVPEMIVVTDEIVAMLRHLLADVTVPPAAELVGLFESGRTEFVTHPHTLAHYRDAWYPRLLYRGGARAWEAGAGQAFEARVRARTCQLVEPQHAAPLPADRAAAVGAVLAEACNRSEGRE